MLKKKNIFSSLHKFNKKIAIYNKYGEKKTYAKLLKDSDYLSGFFDTKKVIIIFSDNSYEFIVCHIAATRSNLVSIFINPNINKKDLFELYKKYLPEYIFCKKKTDLFGKYKKILNLLDFSLFKIKKSHRYSINSELSCLLTTSGTTGDSKYVKLSRENILSNTTGISKLLNIKSNDTAITTMPPYYSYALSIINTHLMNGSTIIINDFSIIDKKFWILFNKLKPNNLNGVPYTYEILNKINFEKMKMSNLKYITQAGGKLDDGIKNKLINLCEEKKIKFYVMYGQAEASPRISIMPANLITKFPRSVGNPMPGGEVWVEDDKNKKVLKRNVQGNLVYKGKNVFLGYSHSYKDLGKKNEMKNTLKTGDIGFIDKNGLIYITGRKKRILKIFGIRISLDLLENELKKRNYDCVCFGNDKKLKIFLKKNKKLDFNQFNANLKNITRLSPNFYEIIQVTKFRRNEFGKIIYKY